MWIKVSKLERTGILPPYLRCTTGYVPNKSAIKQLDPNSRKNVVLTEIHKTI
jgi:hypothetical protein